MDIVFFKVDGFLFLNPKPFPAELLSNFSKTFSKTFHQFKKKLIRKQSIIGVKKDPIFRVFLVARVGVEPTRCHHRRILSPLRLPIPPSRHTLLNIPKWRKKSRPSGFFMRVFLLFPPLWFRRDHSAGFHFPSLIARMTSQSNFGWWS